MDASILAINPGQRNDGLQRAAFIAMQGEKYFDEANLTREEVLKALPDTMACSRRFGPRCVGRTRSLMSGESSGFAAVAASVETIATLRKLLNHLIDGQHLRDGKLDGTYVDWRGDTSARYQAQVDGTLEDIQEEEYWSNIEANAAADDDYGVTFGDGDEEDGKEEEQAAVRSPP